VKTAPAFWGRYFSTPTTGGPVEYSPDAENAILRAAGIFVLPIARQTGGVDGSEQQRERDGRANSAALIATFGLSYLVSQGREFLMFLDVEPCPGRSPGHVRASAQVRAARYLRSAAGGRASSAGHPREPPRKPGRPPEPATEVAAPQGGVGWHAR
jgi:hypothetical protein